jgi:hypothetical protein
MQHRVKHGHDEVPLMEPKVSTQKHRFKYCYPYALNHYIISKQITDFQLITDNFHNKLCVVVFSYFLKLMKAIFHSLHEHLFILSRTLQISSLIKQYLHHQFCIVGIQLIFCDFTLCN